MIAVATNEQSTLNLEAAANADRAEISLIDELMLNKGFRLAVRITGFIVAPILAAGITFGLFYFMQSLVSGGAELNERVIVVKVVDPTMPEIELLVIEEIDRPEPIASVTDREPELQDKRENLDSGPSLNIERGSAQIDMEMDLPIAKITATDGDYLPLVAIPAQYPERARVRDIEGWCIVSFTVNGFGNVVEDSIRVVDAEPPEIFDRSAMQAAARFKFQPRTKNGVGVEVPDVQYLFTFKFND